MWGEEVKRARNLQQNLPFARQRTEGGQIPSALGLFSSKEANRFAELLRAYDVGNDFGLIFDIWIAWVACLMTQKMLRKLVSHKIAQQLNQICVVEMIIDRRGPMI